MFGALHKLGIRGTVTRVGGFGHNFLFGALVPLRLKPVTAWKGTLKRIPSTFSTQLENSTTLVQDARDSGWESYLAPGSAKMDGKAVTRQKVAILIAGTVARFHLNTSAEHLVAPLVQSGWEVDYFSSLFLGRPAPWKAKAEMKELEADWEFQQANETHIKNTISQKLSSSGARVIFNHVFSEQDVDLAEKNFIDTDIAFWPRPERRGKTARNNFILMWRNLAILWQKAKKHENMHGKYSYVIILRDDAYWFRDFNLTQILELRGIERLPGRPGEGQLYSVLCDETHISTGDLGGLIDYFFLVDRVAADIVCTTYERIIQPTRFGDGWARFRKKTHFHNSDSVRWKCHMCFALTSFFGKNILENTLSR